MLIDLLATMTTHLLMLEVIFQILTYCHSANPFHQQKGNSAIVHEIAEGGNTNVLNTSLIS